MDTTDRISMVIGLLILAAASPFIYEQATSDEERVNEQYWTERGYAPLPETPNRRNEQ